MQLCRLLRTAHHTAEAFPHQTGKYTTGRECSRYLRGPPTGPPPALNGDSSPAGVSTGLGVMDAGRLPFTGLPLSVGVATAPERLRLNEPLPLLVRAMLLMLVWTLGLTVCREKGQSCVGDVYVNGDAQGQQSSAGKW